MFYLLIGVEGIFQNLDLETDDKFSFLKSILADMPLEPS